MAQIPMAGSLQYRSFVLFLSGIACASFFLGTPEVTKASTSYNDNPYSDGNYGGVTNQNTGSSHPRKTTTAATSTQPAPDGDIATTTLTSTATTSVTYAYTRDLTLGSTGEDVRMLQNFLILKGYLETSNNTGYFGQLTRAALIAYQTAVGIVPPAGYFGPLTRAAFTTTGIPSSVSTTTHASSTVLYTRDLTLGWTGEDVRALQIYLNAHGYAVAQGGAGSPGQETLMFGYATKAALARFQSANGIMPALGFFGAVTRAYIQSH